ncbi:hypothetical protein [Xanthomonas euvesicatoria]|uniref:hypothetical protein n=1 Tax=Xanthomonas euvesicatoria TaxID=456327 RepID=UPI003CCE6D2F
MTGTINARWIRQTRRKAIALLVLAALPLAATATTPRCVPRYPTPHAAAAMFDMATSTAQALDALPDAKVVLLARGGQDLSRYGSTWPPPPRRRWMRCPMPRWCCWRAAARI